MRTWEYNTGDVLLITHHDKEQVARIERFEDSQDDTKPLYVNLRISDGKRWSSRAFQIQPNQIIKLLPNWYAEQQAAFDASIKEAAERAYAKMSPAERECLALQHAQRQRRSPLDLFIDRACGIE